MSLYLQGIKTYSQPLTTQRSTRHVALMAVHRIVRNNTISLYIPGRNELASGYVISLRVHNMKNTLLKLVVFGLFILLNSEDPVAQPKGRWVNSQVSYDSLIISNLLFADSNVGYLSGYRWRYYLDRYDVVNGYRKFYYFRTTDGGANWTPIFLGKYSFPEDGELDALEHSPPYHKVIDLRRFSIIIATPSIAFLNAYYLDSDSVIKFTLLKTTNSGSTWLPVPAPQAVYARKFFSEKFGFGDDGAKLVYTVDGGIRWFDLPGRISYNYTINGVNYHFNSIYIHDENYGFIDSSHLMFISPRIGVLIGGDTIPNSPTYGITSFLSTDRGSNWAISNWNDPLIPKLSINNTDTFFANGILKTVKNSQSVFRFMLSDMRIGSYSDDEGGYWLGVLGGNAFVNNYGGVNNSPGGGGSRTYSNRLTTFYKSTNYGKDWNANRSFLNYTREMVATSSDDIWMTTLTKPFANDTVMVFGRYLKDTLINGTNTQVLDSGWHIEINSLIRSKNINMYASHIVHSTDGGNNWDIDSVSLHDPEIGEYDSRFIRSTDPNHLWVGAMKNGFTYVFRYKAPAVNAVIEDIPPADYPNFINIFPNPSNDKVKVALWRNAGIKQIRIFDILGREISAPTKQLTQSSFELDVSLVSAGPYILVCDIAGGTNVARTLMVRK